MAANSLYPGYIEFSYLTAKALHSMRIPTRAWEGGIGATGGYTCWDGSPIAWEDMVDALVAALVVSLPTTTTIVDATAYSIAAPTDAPAVPVGYYAVGEAGLSVATPIHAATATFSFKTTAFGDMRIVLADIAPSTNFIPRTIANFVTGDTTLAAALQHMTAAWSGRDGTRPSMLRRVVFDLNDGLRRAYKYG